MSRTLSDRSTNITEDAIVDVIKASKNGSRTLKSLRIGLNVGWEDKDRVLTPLGQLVGKGEVISYISGSTRMYAVPDRR